MAEKFLDRVYELKTTDETRALYDAWSASYDAEVAENGYATPGRVAEALAAQSRDPTAPVLDFGCGTGLSGLALSLQGFTAVDGADLSAEMLKRAAEKGVYRRLWQVEAGEPIPGRPGEYAAITAIGVIGAGAAPVSTFDLILSALLPGGLFALSFNDHALADPMYEGRLDASVAIGESRLLFKEHGPHLPGIDLKSSVYVLEKT